MAIDLSKLKAELDQLQPAPIRRLMPQGVSGPYLCRAEVYYGESSKNKKPQLTVRFFVDDGDFSGTEIVHYISMNPENTTKAKENLVRDLTFLGIYDRMETLVFGEVIKIDGKFAVELERKTSSSLVDVFGFQPVAK